LVLSGQVALVSGATSGIGKAVAAQLVREGARVAVVGSQDLEKANRTILEISASPLQAQAFVADIADIEQVDNLISDVTHALGPIDILVNSAGIWSQTPLGATKPARIRRMVDVNLVGTISLMNAVVPGMKERRRGQIVNIASIAAFVPSSYFSVYAAVKAGIVGLTRAAGVELAPFGIHVNAVSPGNTETPMNEHVRSSPEAAPRRQWIRTITPSNRLFTPAEEIAAAVLFLVSGQVSGMYGTVLAVDEGRSAGLPSALPDNYLP
jgi:3-oxoacyl-[acyl-carrier protein] reductase